MPRLQAGRAHPSKEPLSPEDEEIVRAYVAQHVLDPDSMVAREARIVGLLFRFGFHPIVLAQPEAYGLDYHPLPPLVRWRRAKTERLIRARLRDGEAIWVEPAIRELQENPCSASNINRLVHSAGRRMGVPELTPRSLRHDVAARLSEKSIAAAGELLGVSLRVLSGYARRKEAQQALDRVTEEGF